MHSMPVSAFIMHRCSCNAHQASVSVLLLAPPPLSPRQFSIAFLPLLGCSCAPPPLAGAFPSTRREDTI